MRILLFGLGFLALLSGALKFRERIRSRIGTSPLSLAELALGLAACFVATSMPQPTFVHSAVAAAICVALVAAGVHQSRLTHAFQRRRDRSEAHRLQHFVDMSSAVNGGAASAEGANGAETPPVQSPSGAYSGRDLRSTARSDSSGSPSAS